MAPSRSCLVLATLLCHYSCFVRCEHPSVVSPSTGSVSASTQLPRQGHVGEDHVAVTSGAAQLSDADKSPLDADERLEGPTSNEVSSASQVPPPEAPIPIPAPPESRGAAPALTDVAASINTETKRADGQLLVPSKRRRTALVLLMGAVSGMAHIMCSFRYEYYANMMTGNTIRWTLATSRADAVLATFFGTVVLSYLVGASLYRILDLLVMTQSTRAMDVSALRVEQLKLINLSWMSPISSVIFGFSDVVHQLVLRRRSATAIHTTMCRLSTLAVGFGMVNAATQDTLNSVTNAATGHITRLGLGAVDQALLLWCHGGIGRETTRSSSSEPNNSAVSVMMAAAQSTAESTNLSFQFLAVLISSLILSSIACRRHWIPLDELDPVLGTLFGVTYAALLFWYTFPFVTSPWGRIRADQNVGHEAVPGSGRR